MFILSFYNPALELFKKNRKQNELLAITQVLKRKLIIPVKFIYLELQV